ncbi:hypothetical protein ACTXT7_014372 [Hymenolepis weldensis]
MAQPLEDPRMSPRYPSCGMLPLTLQSPFELASALAPPTRFPHLPPPPPPAPGACAPHPMHMLQWMRSILGAAASQGGPGGPSPPQQPPSHTPPTSNGGSGGVFANSPVTSEALHLAGLLSGGIKGGPSPLGMVSPHPTHPVAPPPQSTPMQAPLQMNPYSHEQMTWQNDSQDESEQLRRFRQALCTGNLDPQTMKIYQNFRYSLKMRGHGIPRRKNTTRETTGLLKAWLNEHRKNPYPNKSEKIMLAVITKMSLTQVSTWFANARRRLKKENKATWSLASSLDQHFTDLEDEGFSVATGDVYPTDQTPTPPSQHNNSPLHSQAFEKGEDFGESIGEDTSMPAAKSTESGRNGKIWSVVEMTEER